MTAGHEPTPRRPFDPQETLHSDSGAALSGQLAPGLVLRQRYRLEEEIGRGGMGIVFRAADLELNRKVAIKLLPDATGSAAARARLLREARLAAGLNHPHIVAVYDVGEDRGITYFVMELVDGPTLRQAPPADYPGAVEIARQICDALEHAHANGLVHRDLKPENVLMVPNSVPTAAKLADLGLALPAHGSDLTRSGSIAGTVAYMAPEQALGQQVDGRADLYALGAMLYELTTGRQPFLGDNPLAIVSQHVHAPVVPPRALRPDFPAALEGVILRLLAKDPSQRFATAAGTRAALDSALAAPAAAAAEEPGGAVALLDVLSRGRLVGRAEELAQARELWHRAREGRGHCVLLSGEPGAGKTRLARELIIQAALDGAAVLSGACYEYEATTPYLPFVEAFRRWVREQKDDGALRQVLGDSAPQIAKLAPEIAARIGPFPSTPGLEPHEERLRFFDAVAQALAAMARPRSLLVYIDDLHWADSSTLWLLGHLLRHLRDERVLFMASYREIELDRAHPLAKALVDWNRERLTNRIVLGRFAPGDTRLQLGALLGEDVSEDFAGAVHRETDGNPFFVEEVLKALIERGSVRRESGRWDRCEITDLEIPQSVKAAIGYRLDRVSPECNNVLRSAAVLGKVFQFEELAAAAGDQGEDVLLDALDEAAAAQLVLAGRDDSFAFTHDKIREVLYEEMNPIRRRRLHLRTAEGLERLQARQPVPVEALAHHYIEAGEHERGLGCAKEAAVEALRIFAYDEAIAAYGRALECAETLGLADEQLKIEEAIGETFVIGGDLLPACEHFERALALAKDPIVRARLQTQVAGSLVTNGDPRGLEAVRAALQVLDPQTHPIETGTALAIEGRFHHLAGQHRKAIELLERGVALVEPGADGKPLSNLQAGTLLTLYPYLAGAYQHLGRYADANEWARRSLEFGRKYHLPSAESAAYEFMGENAVGAGDWAQGLEYCALEREIALRLHSREREGWSHLVGALCALYLKDWERSAREFAAGIALAEAIGERRLTALMKYYYALLLAETGRLDEAERVARENIPHAEQMGLLYMRTEARRCLAHALWKRGAGAEVVRLCDEIHALTAGTDARVSKMWMGALEVEALCALGRVEAARERLAAWSALVSECQSPHSEREVARLKESLAALSYGA